MAYDLYSHNRNWGARIMEYQYKGYRMVSMENRLLRISIAVDKGTDIIEFLYKPLDIDFMWRSYQGLRGFCHTVPTSPNMAGPFLDYYPGGWQELFPNAGMDCQYRGAPLGIHGEVCLLPWDYRIERDDPEMVAVRFFVRTLRTPFLLEKTLSLDGTTGTLTIDERIVNESGEALEFMWGHHPSFGGSFLGPSCRVFLPDCSVFTPEEQVAPSSRLQEGQRAAWPVLQNRQGEDIDLSRIPGTGAASHDMAYMMDFKEGWYAIVNQEMKLGFGMCWDERVFPFLWFWQVYLGGRGYPWYGSTYVVALEPVSSYPQTLTRAIEAGSQLKLEPGAEKRTRLLAVAFSGQEEVKGIDFEKGVLY